MLAVMVEHYAGLSGRIPVGAGFFGVSLFFVLSGFLITSNIARDADGPDTNGRILASFYVRRSFRLFPAYYLVLAILAALQLGDIRQNIGWYLSYLANFRMAYSGEQNVFWTLCVEEQFYLLWPFVFLLIPARFRLAAALGLPAIALLAKLACLAFGYPLSYLLLPYQLTCLGAGCIIGILSTRSGRPFDFAWTERWRTTGASAAAIGFAGALLLWFAFGPGLMRSLFNDLLCVPLFILLVIGASQGFKSRLLKPVFDNGVLQYLGRISYGIYLVHNWVPKISDRFLGLDGLPKLAFSLALTLAVCSLSWAFLEKPLIRLGQRLSAAPRRPAAPLAAEAA